jgi:hypothetical protein
MGSSPSRERGASSQSTKWIFTTTLISLALLGYVFAVRFPSLGTNVRLYAAFADFFNTTGGLPQTGMTVGQDNFASYYADFPGLSLRVYSVLALFGASPNRFVWAAYYLIPLTVVLTAISLKGHRIGLSLVTARTLALVSLFMGICTARFYEDKAFLLWVPLLAFLLASLSPFMGAVATGIFAGWTGLLPLGPLLAAFRRQTRKVLLIITCAISALVVALAAGPATITLLNNRATREAGATFWFGFWRYLPFLDTTPIRTAIALAMGIVAVVAFQRRWISFPAAFSASAFFVISSSNSFQHSRIMMLLPLAVFLLPTVKWQIGYLWSIAVWSFVPLLDFFGYGYFFAGAGLSGQQDTLLAVYTNAPVFFFYAAFAFAIVRGIRDVAPSTANIFEPNALAGGPPASSTNQKQFTSGHAG